MIVKFYGQADVEVSVDTMRGAVTEITFSGEYSLEEPYTTIYDEDSHIVEGDFRHIQNLIDGMELYDADKEVLKESVEKAMQTLGKTYLPNPETIRAGAIAAWTAGRREARKRHLIGLVEQGNTNAIKTLRDEFGVEIKLTVEVVGEAAVA